MRTYTNQRDAFFREERMTDEQRQARRERMRQRAEARRAAAERQAQFEADMRACTTMEELAAVTERYFGSQR